MNRAGYAPTHVVPAGQPAALIHTKGQPRALPQVHGALRANDPQAPTTQPSVAKKAPPSSGRPLPPMIGTTGPIQPPPPPGLPTSTPTTPAHPPRPPLSALPR